MWKGRPDAVDDEEQIREMSLRLRRTRKVLKARRNMIGWERGPKGDELCLVLSSLSILWTTTAFALRSKSQHGKKLWIKSCAPSWIERMP